MIVEKIKTAPTLLCTTDTFWVKLACEGSHDNGAFKNKQSVLLTKLIVKETTYLEYRH